MQPKNRSNAEKKRDEILERCNDGKRKTVNKLWNILVDLDKKGITRLTVGIVGRACEEAGILKTQSIWNASGVDYRALIDAFSADKGRPQKARPNREINVEEAVKAVNDLDARVRLLAIIEDNERLNRELATLRAFYKRVKLVDTNVSESSVPGDSPTALCGSPQPDSALMRFLSVEWQDEAALQEDETGALYSSDGMPVAPPGFTDELRRIIGTKK